MRIWRFSLLLLVLVATLAAAPASASPAATTAQPHAADQQILVMIRVAPDHYRPGSYGSSYSDELGQSARNHVAREIARKYRLKILDNWPMPMVGIDCFVMLVPSGHSVEQTAFAVSRDANVSWAEAVGLYTARGFEAGHNDPLYAAQPAAAQWHLGDLHRISSGRGTHIAIVDSGIDAAHPDLSGQLLLNRNFVSGKSLTPEQHGTAVAGIIGAKADNWIGIAGIAPGARLLGLRACWQELGSAVARCDTLSLAKALYFAVENHADIINMSLSGPDDRLLREIIKLALQRRQSVVAAFDPEAKAGGFPASMTGVIPVADASLAGPRAGVYIAPGRDVPTTAPGGRWFLVSGSSFAAAHVTGLLALLRGRQKSGELVLISERPGAGPIDACASILRLVRSCDCTCPTSRFATAVGRH